MIPQLARVPKAYIHAPWTMPTPIAEAAGCVIGRDYPAPIVEHALACQRALATFATSLVSAVPTRREVR
jgi:deoxyribodipyrimidine photo-lyase